MYKVIFMKDFNIYKASSKGAVLIIGWLLFIAITAVFIPAWLMALLLLITSWLLSYFLHKRVLKRWGLYDEGSNK